MFIPALCRKMGVPYVIVKNKGACTEPLSLLTHAARLGTVVHRKTATVLAMESVRSEDQAEFGKLVSAAKDGYLAKAEETRRTCAWRGFERL